MKKFLMLLTFFVLTLVTYSIVLAQSSITLEHTKELTITVQGGSKVPIVIGQRGERIENLRTKLSDVTQKILDGLPDHVKNKHNKWEYGLVVDERPNAFGGGGGIYVDVRYVEKLSDNELAFVVAHEIGHTVLGHGKEEIIDIKKRLGATLSRIDERAADHFAAVALSRAGYSSDEIREGATKFFERLKEEGIGEGIRSERIHEYVKYALMEKWPTHPSAVVRIEQIKEVTTNLGIEEAKRNINEVRKYDHKPSSDASKVKEGTPHQLVHPVKVEFRQEYDLLFTQSADSLGSRYGSHSGTITDGTRFNISGDSRAGDFTGSITNGRTVAEPGYTPVTHNNTPGSGTSVGTVSAKGFKEGDLKGNMTITIPAGIQTVNVSGNITISKDGSLSMPSYSGPVTDNATSTKVGTMTGTWNQGATR